MMPSTHPLDRFVSLVLAGLETPPSRHIYEAWEECFVQRWGMIPDTNVPDLSAKYRDMHYPGQTAFTCLEAMRIFYTNQFVPAPGQLVAQFIEDFQKIPKQQVEPTWENDPHTGARLERYNDQHDPKSGINNGRRIFDFGRGRQPR